MLHIQKPRVSPDGLHSLAGPNQGNADGKVVKAVFQPQTPHIPQSSNEPGSAYALDEDPQPQSATVRDIFGDYDIWDLGITGLSDLAWPSEWS